METNPPTREVRRTCPLCEATCGLILDVRGEDVLRIRGDEADPLSRGFLCPKGPALADLHRDPDRLRTPLVRRGNRLEEATWDEAFEAIEKGVEAVSEAHGREAVAAYLGNPNVHGLAGAFFIRPFLKALRTRHIYSASTVDQMPKHVSSGLLFGSPGAIPVPDLDRSDFLLMLGANPFESNGSLCTAPDFPGRIRALRSRGGRVVVVDPRRTRTARAADQHLAIRPGTDAVLLLALAHRLFADDRVDSARVAELCHAEEHDIETVRTWVAPFTAEAAASTCGLEAETIRALARDLADAPSAAVYGRIGIHTSAFGTLASWACDLLNVITCNLDRPGGAMFPRAAHTRRRLQPGGRGFSTGRWHSRVRELPEAMGELPVATLVDEMETPGAGQVRALFTIAGNPVLSTPEGDRLGRALEGLDFMVSLDIYLNETTRHADVVLPAPSPLERPHYDASFSNLAVRNTAKFSPAVFATDAPSEVEILLRLAMIASGKGAGADPAPLGELMLGGLLASLCSDEASPAYGRSAETLRAALGDRPIEELMLDAMLRGGAYGDGFDNDAEGLSLARLEEQPEGIDHGPLEPQLPTLLQTPSGRVDLAPDAIGADVVRLSSLLGDAAERREGTARFELVGRRHVRSNNSWMHNIGSLVSGKPRCTLEIHPEDARDLGLAPGDDARVRSRVGELVVPIEVTDTIRRGVVSLPHGWGHDEPGTRLGTARAHAGVNSNQLTDAGPLDPLSGNASLNAIPVTIASVEPTSA